MTDQKSDNGDLPISLVTIPNSTQSSDPTISHEVEDEVRVKIRRKDNKRVHPIRVSSPIISNELGEGRITCFHITVTNE